ncbi:MAG: hypothetical protein KDC79_07490 [Cyclobacteriaceae bacterium]|nr:hypothetical protein [Cyclobacteriaceae bacterium]
MKPVIGLALVFILSSFIVKPLPTSLKITTLNELGNIEDSVKVTLFKSIEDYRKEANPVMESQYTDKKGRTTFKGLDATKYYILAEKGDKNNDGAGVETDALEEGKINKLTIIIE